MLGKNLTRSEWFSWQIEKSALEDKVKALEKALSEAQSKIEFLEEELKELRYETT